MKMSKHDRKIYNQGKTAGYIEGYKKGLHDGNPFTAIYEAVNNMTKNLIEMMNDPETIKIMQELNEKELQAEKLEIEGDENNLI